MSRTPEEQAEIDRLEAEEIERLPKPGQLIKQARSQRHLSLADLAAKTRLSEAVLAAVEMDDFAALGQPVYARGYYRKCADVLALNGAVLVEAYEKRSGTGSPVPQIQQRPSIEYREKSGALKTIVLVLVLGAGLGYGAWWALTTKPAWLPEILRELKLSALAVTRLWA